MRATCFRQATSAVVLLAVLLFISTGGLSADTKSGAATKATIISDLDGDGVPDDQDNCPETYNPGQEETDGDGVGDACDACQGYDDNLDQDYDFIPDGCDPCPTVYDPEQTDSDGDGVNDACDNCPVDYNPNQEDVDNNNVGDICEVFEGTCVGRRGNANGDVDDKCNVSDASYLLAWLFGIPPGPAPVCMVEADANASGGPNISDITYLMAYLFGIPAGPPPRPCP